MRKAAIAGLRYEAVTPKWIVTAPLEVLAAHLYLEQIRGRVAAEDEAACQMTIILQGRAR